MNGAKLMKSKKLGAVLALVVLVIAVMLVIGGGLLTLGANARIYAIRTAADISARCAADAGLTEAIAVMNGNPSYYVNNPPQQLDFILLRGSEPAATFNYTVTAPENKFRIVSTGTCNVAQRKVWGLLRLRGVGEIGVLVRNSMILKAGTTVDGSDSRDPDNPNPDVEVQIGTASTAANMVVLNNGVHVNGDVLVGYGGNPDTGIKDLTNDPCAIEGYKGTLDEEPEFPPVTPPLLPNYSPKEVSATGKALTIDETWNGTYSMINLKSKGEATGQVGELGRPGRLIIASGNNVVLHLTNTGNKDSISLGVNCEIIIEKGATLNLYVDGDISSGTGSGFNNQGLPPDLKLWGLTQDPLPADAQQKWQLNAKSEYFGQIYAPEATVQVNNSGDLYGAFTAYNFTMMNSGNLYYDGALRDVNPNDPGVRFVLKRWGEGEENLP